MDAVSVVEGRRKHVLETPHIEAKDNPPQFPNNVRAYFAGVVGHPYVFFLSIRQNDSKMQTCLFAPLCFGSKQTKTRQRNAHFTADKRQSPKNIRKDMMKTSKHTILGSRKSCQKGSDTLARSCGRSANSFSVKGGFVEMSQVITERLARTSWDWVRERHVLLPIA